VRGSHAAPLQAETGWIAEVVFEPSDESRILRVQDRIESVLSQV
jgi:hypothetical protein